MNQAVHHLTLQPVAKFSFYKFQIPGVFTCEVIMLQVTEMLSQETTDFGNMLSKVITS